MSFTEKPFGTMYWMYTFLALVEGFSIINGDSYLNYTVKKLPGLSLPLAHRRSKREVDNQCNKISSLYNTCKGTHFQDLSVIKNQMFDVNGCSHSANGTSRIDCLNNFFCGTGDDSCLSVYSSWSSLGCSVGSDDPLLKKKVAFLSTLCYKPEHTDTCLSMIYDAYDKVSKATDLTMQCNVTEFQTDRCKNCHKRLSRLLRTTGCCFGSLVAAVPSTLEKTYELSAEAWKVCQLTLLTCKGSTTSGAEVVTPTTLGMPKTPDERQPSPTPQGGSSSRLIAGAILATIIFIALCVIVGRFVYQRAMRRKQLRYEDYGYTQLRAMEDNLYDDEEDDDQLLSAT